MPSQLMLQCVQECSVNSRGHAVHPQPGQWSSMQCSACPPAAVVLSVGASLRLPDLVVRNGCFLRTCLGCPQTARGPPESIFLSKVCKSKPDSPRHPSSLLRFPLPSSLPFISHWKTPGVMWLLDLSVITDTLSLPVC